MFFPTLQWIVCMCKYIFEIWKKVGIHSLATLLGSTYTLLVPGWTPFCFLLSLLATKWPKVCQENIPHTITPPPAAWTVETRQDGSMLSSSLCHILTLPSEFCSRNRDSSDQATFFQSSIVQFWWACVNCSLCFLFLADRSCNRCSVLLL